MTKLCILNPKIISRTRVTTNKPTKERNRITHTQNTQFEIREKKKPGTSIAIIAVNITGLNTPIKR